VTLHREIFVTVVIIITGMMIALAAVIYQTQRISLERELQRKITATQASSEDLFVAEQKFRASTVSSIAKDWALRRALASFDEATIESALANHSGRINATFSFFIDQDKKIYPGLIPSGVPDEEIRHLISVSRLKDNHLNIVRCGEEYFLVVHQDAFAPTKLGYLTVGFDLGGFESIVKNIAAVSQLNVQIFDMDLKTPINLSKKFSSANNTLNLNEIQKGDLKTLKVGQDNQVILLQPLVSNSQMPLGALFTGSLSKAMADLDDLWLQLSYVFTLCLLAALIVTYFFSKKITKPLLQLLNNASHVTEGNYTEKIAVEGSREINELANEFSQMQAAVLAREKKIVHSANYDPLCGIANRQKFNQTLKRILPKSKTVSILLLDIDKFKKINDNYGHQLGDRLITYFAKLLLRKFDKQCLVSRIGGDEFAVIGFEQTSEELENVITEILLNHKKAINLSGYSIPLQFSAGIAEAVKDEDRNPEQLIHKADIALYAAKLTDCSVTIYNEEALLEYRRNIQIITQLQAISRKEPVSGLYLEYQPKYELVSGKLIGVEALCRWNNKTLGHLAPMDFIQHAESSGTITQLTYNVITLAIAQQARWKAIGLNIPVAVNVSPADIRDSRFCDDLAYQLKRYKINPNMFELEITEHVFIEDSDIFRKQFQRLSKLGIQLSVDDFGSGYANLNGLKDYPFTNIKIDQQFVRLINTNPRGEIIVKTVLNLAKELGVQVIAEGIETESELNSLRELGCVYGQGYFFSRPVSAELIQNLMHIDKALPAIH